MKLLIIPVVMLITAACGYHSYQTRNLLVEAAMFSEGFSLSAAVKLRVADHYMRHGTMPSDNRDLDLPPPKSLFGTSVRRLAVNRGGVLSVEFEDTIGESAMTFTPSISRASGQLGWTCTSDSIEPQVLSKLRPVCSYLPATQASQLMDAIANQDVAQVQTLLASKANPDTVVRGNTPLMLAAKMGHTGIVKALLDAGAQVDNPVLSSERRSPLMVAIGSNKADVVALLLSRGASATQKDYRGMSAMDHAIATDSRLGGARFVLLVSARFNPKFAGIGYTATKNLIDKAAEERRLQILYSELVDAAQRCHTQRIASLLTHENDFDSSELINGKELSKIIQKPDCITNLQQYLLGKKSFQKSSKAHLAYRIDACDVQGVDRVFSENPMLDVSEAYAGKRPIDRAVGNGCHTVVRLMMREKKLATGLDGGLIVNAIMQAPQDTLVKLVGVLIQAEVDVNGVGISGKTPLSVAISLEQPVVAKILISAGASVDQPTQNGSYPVIEAAKKGYVHLVLQMVSEGADLNVRDSLGRTALFAAVSRGKQNLVQALINEGADARISDKNGVNPVLLAESRNLKSIKSVLVASRD